mmetsp:Transcript_37538/g.101586  ORF Transcript_37538/g.101586 Transcript_37538/m.101586 type:complete len:116 (-) Transcript_37538:9-356(-)
MVEDVNVITWLSSMGLDITDADDLFTMVTRECKTDDEITATDLVKGVARLKGYAKSIDMAVVLHANTRLLEQAQSLRTKVSELKELRKSQLEELKQPREAMREAAMRDDRAPTIS